MYGMRKAINFIFAGGCREADAGDTRAAQATRRRAVVIQRARINIIARAPTKGTPIKNTLLIRT